ncbi:MAG: hypothetical protein ACP5FT_00845 [Acidilobus sp.]
MDSWLEELTAQCSQLIARSSDGVPSLVKVAASGKPESRGLLTEARAAAERLLRVLADEYRMELALPRNVDPLRDFELVVWPEPLKEPFYGLLLLARFPFSIYRGDGRAEYEPLEIVFLNKDGTERPIYAYARVHYDLCEYNLQGLRRLRVLYLFHGHTPYIDGTGFIRLKCPKVKYRSVHVGRKYWDRIWLGAAVTFLKLTGAQLYRLSDLVDLGLVKVMKCPTEFKKDPFKGPLLKGPPISS